MISAIYRLTCQELYGIVWVQDNKEVKTMKKTFIDKVLEERIVDTDKYRYIVDADGIKRLPIEYLGTTKSINSWETVYHWL